MADIPRQRRADGRAPVGEVPLEPDVDVDGDAGLALQAMIRDNLGLPEPTDQDIRKMFDRADAWHDCESTPERLAAINRLTAAFYQDRFPGSWAQPDLAEQFDTDLTGHPDLQPGYAPACWTTLVAHLHRIGAADDEMFAAGVTARASTGRLIDQFRDRAVFPIRHEGVVLGFIGRRHPTAPTTRSQVPSTSSPAILPCSTRETSSTPPDPLCPA